MTTLLAGMTSAGVAQELKAPTGLMCELLGSYGPIRIDNPTPSFSWICGANQAAHAIVVSQAGGGEIWSSGRQPSAQSVNVPYRGEALQPGRYTWRVRTWDKAGKPSPWSQPQAFTVVDRNSTKSEWFDRYPLTKTEVAPASIRKSGGGWFIDFGKAAFGRVRFQATTKGDETVTVHLGERLIADGSCISRKPGGTIRYRKMTQKLRAGTHWYEVAIPPDRRNTHGAAVRIPKSVGEVMPFRWCELEGYPGALTADKIRQVRVHYPFDENAAEFTSSSKVLNDVWELCKYSIEATSFLGVYIDGDRERIPYEGDAYINQLGHYCTDREYSMARYSLEYLIDHPTWPVEWQQHIPLMAWEDYLYTGDDSLLRRRYADIAAKTLQPLAREGGLLAIDKRKMSKAFLQSIHIRRQIRTLVDWPAGERDGHKIVTVDSVVNAFGYRNLVLMSRIARVVGKTGDAAAFEARAKKVYAAYQETFFDKTKGIYRDGKGVNHSSLHANMFPLVFGLVPEQHRASVLKFIRSRGMACSVYAAQHLLDGLYVGGDEAYALKLLTSTGKRSWAHMVYDVGSTISLEAWDNKYKPNQDWNHAWGAAPANLIPRGLMGIRPVEPGCRRMQIKPQIGDLESASIKYPTIRGTIHMAIKQDKSTYRLKLLVPANMTVDLHLPTADPARIRMPAGLSGKPRREHGRTVVELKGGHYDFEVRK